MECVKSQSYQNMSHYHHLHIEAASEFLLICTHQELLQITHSSQFLVDYFANKHLIFRFILLIKPCQGLNTPSPAQSIHPLDQAQNCPPTYITTT